jgi:hypothetical protein
MMKMSWDLMVKMINNNSLQVCIYAQLYLVCDSRLISGRGGEGGWSAEISLLSQTRLYQIVCSYFWCNFVSFTVHETVIGRTISVVIDPTLGTEVISMQT